MNTFTLLAAQAAPPSDDGLTLREVWDALPTDPASIFVLLLMVAFLGFILYFGVLRQGEPSDGGDPGTSSAPPEDPGRRPAGRSR